MAGPPRPAAAPPAYEAVTRGLRVVVNPRFDDDDSDPDQGRYMWTYAVTIENRGQESVQLVARHWIITDGANRTEEVKGPGVVGQQPVLAPGESFEYVSACPLSTPSGIMRGTYRMTTAAGEAFDAVIPAFSLHLPEAPRSMN